MLFLNQTFKRGFPFNGTIWHPVLSFRCVVTPSCTASDRLSLELHKQPQGLARLTQYRSSSQGSQLCNKKLLSEFDKAGRQSYLATWPTNYYKGRGWRSMPRSQKYRTVTLKVSAKWTPIQVGLATTNLGSFLGSEWLKTASKVTFTAA